MSLPDAIVVGAGIVGAACAYELSREGLKVTIVGARVSGGDATAAGMGHIVVMDNSAPEFCLTRYSQELWDALAPHFTQEVEQDHCGTIWVAEDDEEWELARKRHRFYEEHGVACELLDETSVRDCEPALAPGFRGGLRVPGDSVVYPPAAAAWLMEKAKHSGAVLREGIPVRSVEDGVVHLGDGSSLEAGVVVNAAGNHALDLLGAPLPSLKVLPRKGHLAITDRRPGFLRHQVVELGYLKSAHKRDAISVAFNVQPRRTGQMILGSSRQFGSKSGEVEMAVLARMIRRGIKYMPGLADLPIIRTWTGFRGSTQDGLPIIGPVPGSSRVFLATGHEGLGITTSLGTGKIIADLVAGRTPGVDPHPFRAEREVAAA